MACASILGCGLAASPQPPSLHLPVPVHRLEASRSGDQVTLQWTTPKETTDRLRIHAPVKLKICRQLPDETCETVATISDAAGKPAAYTDTLPPELTSGPLRPLTYEIFGLNKQGRSAGPSNPAATYAGHAPPMVQDLSATEIERGVVLHWQPVVNLSPNTSIRLQRKLLFLLPAAKSRDALGSLATTAEPAEVTMEVAPLADGTDPGTALDPAVEFGGKYQYIVTRVVHPQSKNPSIKVSSAPSAPVVIVTRDRFPPAAPTGLVAVPVPASLNHGSAEVDLSWSANTEPDLAQYLVYRRDVSSGTSASQIAPEDGSAPVVAATYRDTHVQPGRTYAYSVVAVDNAGNRSPHSAEVTVTVPQS